MKTKQNEDTKGIPLTRFELEILSWIEQVFYKTGSLPTKDKICEEFDLNYRSLAHHSRKLQWKSTWAARGLPSFDESGKAKQTLTAQQLMVANVMLNEYDRNSAKRKLEALGFTTSQFQAWMADPRFTGYLREESMRRFRNADIVAHNSLVKLLHDGDLNAIKYYFDITNIHSTQADSINFHSILAQLMEILARYVPPGVLNQIADDLDNLLSGAPAQTKQLEIAALEVNESPSSPVGHLDPEDSVPIFQFSLR